jgi:hypothetical protein
LILRWLGSDEASLAHPSVLSFSLEPIAQSGQSSQPG